MGTSRNLLPIRSRKSRQTSFLGETLAWCAPCLCQTPCPCSVAWSGGRNGPRLQLDTAFGGERAVRISWLPTASLHSNLLADADFAFREDVAAQAAAMNEAMRDS